jgi:hypothetical protein
MKEIPQFAADLGRATRSIFARRAKDTCSTGTAPGPVILKVNQSSAGKKRAAAWNFMSRIFLSARSKSKGNSRDDPFSNFGLPVESKVKVLDPWYECTFAWRWC